jgi:hypothetical protein
MAPVIAHSVGGIRDVNTENGHRANAAGPA